VRLTAFVAATIVVSPRVVAPSLANAGLMGREGWPCSHLGIDVRALVGRSTNRRGNLDGRPDSVDDGARAFLGMP